MSRISLYIDGQQVNVPGGTTLWSAAGLLNIDIPVLCYSGHCRSSAGCMVCAVKELKTGRMLPSCSVHCAQGMEIDSSSLEVHEFRRKALNLILSEHRGACEAPCNMVCPQGLDIPRLMQHLAEGKTGFEYSQALCRACGGKCEKVCNRKKVDSEIKIRDLLAAAGTDRPLMAGRTLSRQYNHLFGKLSEADLAEMRQDRDDREGLSGLQKEALRCLQCACSAKSDCTLRSLAGSYQARQSAYKTEKKNDFKKIPAGRIVFQPSKCIRCGRCVALGKKLNPGQGPVMAWRSRKTMVGTPAGMDYKQTFAGFEEAYIRECPTGAIDWRSACDE